MSRIMYDALIPGNLPPGGGPADLIAGYVDGGGAWPATAWSKFPGKRLVHISQSGLDIIADVVDCENGDVSPEGAASWCARKRETGGHPCIYTSAANQSTVVAALALIGEPAPLWWIAEWTGSAHDFPGAVATQWTNGTLWDTSSVPGPWPGVDPSPITVPATSDATPQGVEYPETPVAVNDGIASPIVAMVNTPSDSGYWLVGSDGGVFAFGTAQPFTPPWLATGAQRPVAPITGASASKTGKGLYLVCADGGILTLGDAVFRGSVPGLHLPPVP